MKEYSTRCRCCLTVPLGSAEGGMGPKWSLGTVTMMRPLAALALPLRTALQEIKLASAPPCFSFQELWAGGGSAPAYQQILSSIGQQHNGSN